jgi:hypothetical protein
MPQHFTECGLTLPSRGQLPGYALQLPLMSNVRRLVYREDLTHALLADSGEESKLQPHVRELSEIHLRFVLRASPVCGI